MTENRFARYVAESIRNYAGEKVASGDWSAEESLDRAGTELEKLLPLGLRTRDHHFFTIQAEPAGEVGILWFAVIPRAGRKAAYVYDVAIGEEHRRKGYASEAFQLLEKRARSMGLAGIALHVFAHNRAARDLYAGLGFQEVDLTLFKEVRHPQGG